MKVLLSLLTLAAAPAFANPAPPASCPQTTEQLSENLARAKQRFGAEGEVRAEFDVGADGRARLIDVQGTRIYRAHVRNAIDSLDCHGGTPQRYAVRIRFIDPVPRTMAHAAPATVAHSQPATPH